MMKHAFLIPLVYLLHAEAAHIPPEGALVFSLFPTRKHPPCNQTVRGAK